jgi:hypothetical protein
MSITDSASTQKNIYSTLGFSQSPDTVKESHGMRVITPEICQEAISNTPYNPSHIEQTSIAEIDE